MTVCEPVAVEENAYVAMPLASVTGEPCTAPSTVMVTVPVGIAVIKLEPETTTIVMASLAPTAGALVPAESAVFDAAALTVAVRDPLDVP